MPLGLGAALGISALGNLGSNLLQNSGNRRSQKRAARYNLELWQRQNAYNHPSEQMKRLREAGLNPHMIYGGTPSSATGNAGDISPMKGHEVRFDNPLRDINMFADYDLKNAQTDNVKSQNDVNEQQAILTAAQTADTVAKGAKSKVEAEIAKELKQTSVDAAKEELRQKRHETIRRDLDNTLKSKTLKDNIEKIYYETQMAKKTMRGKELDNTIKQLEIDLKKLGIEKNDPWFFRIFGRKWENRKNSFEELKKGFNKKDKNLKP